MQEIARRVGVAQQPGLGTRTVTRACSRDGDERVVLLDDELTIRRRVTKRDGRIDARMSRILRHLRDRPVATGDILLTGRKRRVDLGHVGVEGPLGQGQVLFRARRRYSSAAWSEARSRVAGRRHGGCGFFQTGRLASTSLLTSAAAELRSDWAVSRSWSKFRKRWS